VVEVAWMMDSSTVVARDGDVVVVDRKGNHSNHHQHEQEEDDVDDHSDWEVENAGVVRTDADALEAAAPHDVQDGVEDDNYDEDFHDENVVVTAMHVDELRGVGLALEEVVVEGAHSLPRKEISLPRP
jgi:signal peptidase I